MDEVKVKKLQEIDVDVKGGISRFAGNAGMYERFLDKFPSEPTFGLLVAAMKQQNLDEAQSAAHTLKGVAGNLGMNRLYLTCSDMVGHLRSGEQKKAEHSYEMLKTAYEEIINVVQLEERGNLDETRDCPNCR